VADLVGRNLLGGEGGGEQGGQGDGGDQANRPAQGPDHLNGHDLGGGDAAKGLAADGEQHQQGQGRPGVGQEQGVHGGRDVVPADREGSSDELTKAGRGVGPPQFEHQRGLGHGDVVQNAEPADDDPGQQQPAQRQATDLKARPACVLAGQAGQCRGRDEPGRQRGRQQ
jgi:hypothetical protein